LDPNGPFRVHAGGRLDLKRGERIVLPLFANRNGAAIEYIWTVTQRPSGSSAAIENAKGAVTMSRHWSYAYPEGQAPTFTADADGEYVVQLQASLAFEDRAYPEAKSSTSEIRLNVADPGKPLSCASAMPVGAPLAAAGLALAAFLARRRAAKAKA
jgi:hypothetical protein